MQQPPCTMAADSFNACHPLQPRRRCHAAAVLATRCRGTCVSELMQRCAAGTAGAGRCSPPADPRDRGAPAAAHWLVQAPYAYAATSSAATLVLDIMHVSHDGCCAMSAIVAGVHPRLPTHRPPCLLTVCYRQDPQAETPDAKRMVHSIIACANEMGKMTNCASCSLTAPSSRHGGQRDGTVLRFCGTVWQLVPSDLFADFALRLVSSNIPAATAINCH